MKIVADIHLHSYYSRATSKTLNLENLYKWAQLKGVQVVGTGDIAHPGWLAEMQEKLEPAEEGLFRLKPDYCKTLEEEIYPPCRSDVRFMLAGEISNIYKKNEKVRKIHNVVFMPSFEATEKFQATLDQIGNIRSDGRPILGLDARDLLEIVLETDPQAHFIPAHIWTPWFSLLGSMSGFDSLEECFEDLSDHIFAVETGLSSDPPMNWRLSQLDKYTLVSNSDAHSPQKLAREANVFNTDLSYPALFDALKSGSKEHFEGTIEFFPEEGKYHYDGHRKCGIRWDPKMTLDNDKICPVCGKMVTVGVMHRVEALADREPEDIPSDRHPYKSLIPLPEILSEIHQVGVTSKRVNNSYQFLLNHLGSELNILLDVPLADLEKLGGSLLSEGIRKVRDEEVSIAAGFDGEFGTIKLFDESERKDFSKQLVFFEDQLKKKVQPQQTNKVATGSFSKNQQTKPTLKIQDQSREVGYSTQPAHEQQGILAGLNEQQKETATAKENRLLITAGPGTGKTRTLTHRVAYLITEEKIHPENVLALTFTNKATEEMVLRLEKLIGQPKTTKLTVRTFHAFCTAVLFEYGTLLGFVPPLKICSDAERKTLLQNILPHRKQAELSDLLARISLAKNQLQNPKIIRIADKNHDAMSFSDIFTKYQNELRQNNIFDFDDLLYYTVKLFQEFQEITSFYKKRFQWIFVDEYQDINEAQYQLLRHLLSEQTHLFVIGDPDQSIYGFRGADRKYFLQFKEDFPDAKRISLEQNYRSTQNILNASNQVISRFANHSANKTWSKIDTPIKLSTYEAATDKAETEFIVHEIEKMVSGTSYFSFDSARIEETAYSKPMLSFGDFAVFFRLKEQNRLLKEAFQRSGIPYQILGETSIYDDKDVQQLIDFLRFIFQPENDSNLESILLQTTESIGQESVRQLKNAASVQQLSIWKLLLSHTFAGLQTRQMEAIEHTIEKLEQLLETTNETVTSILQKVLRLFYPGKLDAHTNDAVSKFILKATLYGSNLDVFLTTIDARDFTDGCDYQSDKVSLMTLHASKGLEFPVVFISGCEENILPFKPGLGIIDVDEERRLIFVGMTRAKQKLYLTNARKRFLFGENMENAPSRFIGDIQTALIQKHETNYSKLKKKTEDNQLCLF